MMKNITALVAVFSLIAFAMPGFFVSIAEAKIDYLCTNQVVIYAQDIAGYTPGGDNDTAILNDRDENLIVKLAQNGDDKIIWPNDYFVEVRAGESLHYKGGGSDFLRIDILDSNHGFIQEVTYEKKANEVVNQIQHNGFIKFTGGEKAVEHNYLLLCPKLGGSNPNTSNQPPVWNQIPTQFGTTGQFMQFSVFASDPNNDTLSYSASNLPSGASFNSFTKVFSWTPNSNQEGNYFVTFRVSDGSSSVDMQVSINVSDNNNPGDNDNDEPEWHDIDTVNATVGQYLQFNVFATDEDGDHLNYSAFNLPSGANFNSSSKTFSWTPNSNQTGTHKVTFVVSDGFSSVDMKVSIKVSSNNNCNSYSYNCDPCPYSNCYNQDQAPIWSQIGAKTVAISSHLQFTVFASDPNGDDLDYDVFNLPTGSVFNSFTRKFSWTPHASQIGNYTVTFRVSDDIHTVDMIVPITVVNSTIQQPITQAPEFINFNPPLVAVEGQFYTYTAFASSNSGAVTYQLISAPAGMSIQASSGLITWTPTYTQGGGTIYPVTVQASNGYGVAIKSYTMSVINVPLGITPPPPSQTPPPAIGVALSTSETRIETQENGDVIVSWNTNKPATARVIYDTASQSDRTRDFTYANATAETVTASTAHSVNLGNLDAGRTYYLRTVSKVGTEVHISNELTFVKIPEGLAGVFGTLAGIPITTWIFIIVSIVLATFLYLGYRKSQMVADH